MNCKWAVSTVLLLVACGPLAAQPPQLRLKSHRAPANWLTPAEPRASLAETRRLTPSRLHLLIQFKEFPIDNTDFEALLDELGRRDVRVLRYLPDNALIISANQDTSWDGLNLILVAPLDPEDKLSELFSRDDPDRIETAVLSLHDDVDPALARLIAEQTNLEILENPDLAPTSVLLRGPTIALHEAAAWDEVYYIFPASEELQAGLPQTACLGGASAIGNLAAAADIASSFGDGWDGPGLGSASLTYFLGALTPTLPAADVKAEITRALAAWSAVVKVQFSPVASPSLRRSIDIFFATGAHGDGFNFDNRGGILAHTFYPPPNPETIAGDLHFDSAELWRIGNDTDVFSVALHELGHSLGLGHNDDPNSVMYPYYRRVSGLRPADITEIRRLYATTGETPTTPSQPPAPAVDLTPPTLRITSPAATILSTNATTLTITGTATDNVGVQRITWSNSGWSQGQIPGAATFTLAPIRLYLGLNTITLKAYDAAGNSSAKTISVTRR
jgi:hypothetical protein